MSEACEDRDGRAGGATMLQPVILRLTLNAPLSPQPDQLCSSSRCRTPRGGSEMNRSVVALAFRWR